MKKIKSILSIFMIIATALGDTYLSVDRDNYYTNIVK